VDSSGWRNRAARGIVQLPGSGDRLVADLGSWRGRKPSPDECDILRACGCPACRIHGLAGLEATRIAGFCNRATHNLWVLLNEVSAIEAHLADDTYETWFEGHLDNSIYLPLVRYALDQRRDAGL
jgi:queuine/archaeosine tRNA-ribosyltransferase